MARSAVSFVLGQGSLGQAAVGEDFISGICLYGTAPGSFATTAKQAVFSVADAESKGITNDYSDETASRAIYTVSGTVTLGDTFVPVVTEVVPVTAANPSGTKPVSFGTVTVTTAATPTGAATDIAAKINAFTYLHGYTATAAIGVVTIIARPGIGIGLNPAVTATPLAVVVTGTSTGTITQQFGTGTGGATAGIASKKSLWYYTISEFFRANATGVLWVGFYNNPDFSADVLALQTAANGACRQIGVFDTTVTTAAVFTSNGTLLQAQGDAMFASYVQADIWYAANIKAISDLSTLVNLQTKSNYWVHNVIMQDGAAAGAQLYINSGVSVANIGCCLGTTSKAAVNQDIGEVGAFNITNDTEMAVPALANGQRTGALASTLLDQLDAYRYIFATTLPNISGTFIVNDWSSIAQTSPYYRQSRTRTIGKTVRLAYANIVPLLKSRIKLNDDGTINIVTIEQFNSALLPVKLQMVAAGEVSNMKFTINSTQNVLSTGKVVVGVSILPYGIADFIEVPISFVAKI
jgi:hypothetical protein